MKIGKCSVPMWLYPGFPAGTCGKAAFGEPPPSKTHRNAAGEVRREDGRYSGYVPNLACPGHGGPSLAEAIKGIPVVRFDGPPGPEAGRFVEVELDGESINAGTWVQDGDYWLLVLDKVVKP